MKKIVIVLIMILAVYSQENMYSGPDDPAGDPDALRGIYLDGNNTGLYMRNTSELGFAEIMHSKWPLSDDGVSFVDRGVLFLGALVIMQNDTVPVENPDTLSDHSNLDSLYFIQSGSSYFVDKDSTGTINWTFHATPGYFNKNVHSPAVSTNPDTWPVEGWPSTNNQKLWPGQWLGRSGPGMINSDLETFMVMNDAQDQEYLPTNSGNIGPYYYPMGKNDLKIGDRNPEITAQRGLPWGGIGLRIAQRTYQWADSLLEDIIFIEYDIANFSNYDLPNIFVGHWLDYSSPYRNGGVYCSDSMNMVLSWANYEVPSSDYSRVIAYAYLESPGNSMDAIDNDNDGLTDERRDNQATNIVGPLDGITDLDQFLNYYELTQNDLRSHWDADEDQDWRDGNDKNQNGIYDLDEKAGDDIGLDGLAPGDVNYPGPDIDGTECNHKPDMVDGIGCEPNFGLLDVNESDMIGLNSFKYVFNWGYFMFINDANLYKLLSRGGIDELQNSPGNFLQFSSSEQFALKRGRESQRFSVALINSFDPLAAIEARQYPELNVVKLKRIAQKIVSNDYSVEGLVLTDIQKENNTTANFALHQNYPNPFNPLTTISFSIPKKENVILKIYDILGKEIVSLINEKLDPGFHKFVFDASSLSTGIYFYTLQTSSFISSKKLIYIK